MTRPGPRACGAASRVSGRAIAGAFAEDVDGAGRTASTAPVRRSASRGADAVGGHPAGTADREERDGVPAERADEQREGDRADADVAAEHPADREHHELDAGAHDPDAPSGDPVQARHQAVARAGAEVRADVEAGRDGEHDDAGGEQQDAHPEVEARRDEPQADVGGRADEQRVHDGAEARLLADRDPQQQHDAARDHRDEAEVEPGLLRDALGEHVPRGDAELAAHDEGDAHAVEEQPDEELHESTDEHGCGVGGTAKHEAIQFHDWPFRIEPIRLKWPHGRPRAHRALPRTAPRRLAWNRQRLRGARRAHPAAHRRRAHRRSTPACPPSATSPSGSGSAAPR